VCIAHQLLHKFIRQVPRDMSKLGSHDPEFGQFMRSDPLQYHFATSAWVGAMRKWANKFQSQAALLSDQPPILIIQGDNDNTVAWQFNCPLAKTKLPHLELAIIPGAEHNLVNESRSYREQVFHQASTFIASIAP
jgi:lysophospholipase